MIESHNFDKDESFLPPMPRSDRTGPREDQPIPKWREEFDKKFAGVQRGGFEYPVQNELKSFFSSVLSELIESIPDEAFLPRAHGSANLIGLKQSLKEKYL